MSSPCHRGNSTSGPLNKCTTVGEWEFGQPLLQVGRLEVADPLLAVGLTKTADGGFVNGVAVRRQRRRYGVVLGVGQVAVQHVPTAGAVGPSGRSDVKPPV